MSLINLDANASYGIISEVQAALSESACFLNPSSLHQSGQKARAVIENARGSVADLLGIKHGSARVIFTSGATEANNAAVMTAFWPYLKQSLTAAERSKQLMLHTEIEHVCVLEPATRIRESGFSVLPFSVNAEGAALIEPSNCEGFDPTLCSMMLVNNETGQILNVSETFTKLKKKYPNLICHSDIVQALAKMPLNYDQLCADIVTISGHKLGALTGVGAMVVAEHLESQALILGGPQEKRFRAGTENVLGIMSLGIAAKVIQASLSERIRALQVITNKFETELLTAIPNAEINNKLLQKVPGVLNVRFPGVLAQDLLVALDLQGVLVSAGSACASGKPLPSHVLLALGLPEVAVRESLRLSFRADFSEIEIYRAIKSISESVQRMLKNRSISEISAVTCCNL
jgi:cysteine desulfurase